MNECRDRTRAVSSLGRGLGDGSGPVAGAHHQYILGPSGEGWHMVGLTDEQAFLLETVKDIAENEFADRTFTYNGSLPRENIDLLADRGFLGINIAEEYGGGGMTEYEAVLLSEVVGRICPDTGLYLAEQQLVAPRTVEMFGSKAAKERYLPEVTSGEAAFSIAMSEPQAGSDVTAMETTVEEEAGELLLNGEKIWVSGAAHYEYAVVWVRFPGEGLGTVIIEFDWDGVEVQQHYTNMAGEKQTQFRMEDVVVPPKNVLTRGEDAFERQLQGLNWERIGTAAMTNACMAWTKPSTTPTSANSSASPSASSRASSGS